MPECLLHLVSGCTQRRAIFAADDYQVLAAELHTAWTAVHFATMLLTAGDLSAAHDMFKAADERLAALMLDTTRQAQGHHSRAAKKVHAALNAATGRAKTTSPHRIVYWRVSMVLHSNWANMWAQRGKWNAAQQHAAKAHSCAQLLIRTGERPPELAVPLLLDEGDVTETTNEQRPVSPMSMDGSPSPVTVYGEDTAAQRLLHFMAVRRGLCRCKAVTHKEAARPRQLLVPPLQWLQESLVGMPSAGDADEAVPITSVSLPGPPDCADLAESGDSWALLASQPLDISVALSSPVEAFSTAWDMSRAAIFVATHGIALDNLMHRGFDAAIAGFEQCMAMAETYQAATGHPANPHWLRTVERAMSVAQSARQVNLVPRFAMRREQQRSEVVMTAAQIVKEHVIARDARSHRRRAEAAWQAAVQSRDASGTLTALSDDERRQLFRLQPGPLEARTLAHRAAAGCGDDGDADWTALLDNPRGQPMLSTEGVAAAAAGRLRSPMQMATAVVESKTRDAPRDTEVATRIEADGMCVVAPFRASTSMGVTRKSVATPNKASRRALTPLGRATEAASDIYATANAKMKRMRAGNSRAPEPHRGHLAQQEEHDAILSDALYDFTVMNDATLGAVPPAAAPPAATSPIEPVPIAPAAQPQLRPTTQQSRPRGETAGVTLSSTFAPKNPALAEEEAFVNTVDVRAINATQRRLRATLPKLNHRDAGYRIIVAELAENEALLRRRREHQQRVRLERDADAIAQRAGMLNAWRNVSSKDAARTATASPLPNAAVNTEPIAAALVLTTVALITNGAS
jgi:hypothetical protein